jgi:hypothetical protein
MLSGIKQMLNDAFLEMNMFLSAKVTDHKLRWDYNHDGAIFSLYIPKWRVPEPWPSRIYVAVVKRRQDEGDRPNLSREDVSADPATRHETIVATIAKVATHTKTIRYCPLGDSKLWELGEPYIPRDLTFDESDYLRLIVCWDIRSRGLFCEQQTI